MLQWLPTKSREHRKLFIMPQTARANSQERLSSMQSAFPSASEPQASEPLTTEEARQSGFDQGYQEGLKRAKQEFFASAQEELEAKLELVQTQYDGSVNELIGGLKALNLALQLDERKQLVDLVKSVCKKILAHELSVSNRKISQTISSALKGLSCEGPFILSVSKDDEALINSDSHQKLATIIVDPDLKRGQFVLDSPRQQLKVDPERQLDRMLFDLFSSETGN